MPEPGDAAGIIPLAELAELAALFDSCEHAFEPTSPEAEAAGRQFEDRAHELWLMHVKPSHPAITLPIFCAKLRTLCRQFLKKNRP